MMHEGIFRYILYASIDWYSLAGPEHHIDIHLFLLLTSIYLFINYYAAGLNSKVTICHTVEK